MSASNDTHGFLVGFSTRGFSKQPSVQKFYGVKKLREPFSRSFGTNETQHLREGQLVGRILLATGAIERDICWSLVQCMM